MNLETDSPTLYANNTILVDLEVVNIYQKCYLDLEGFV